MHHVYILRSQSVPSQRYIGRTDSPRQRLDEHNAGKSPHTAKFRPWTCETLIGLADEHKAAAFECYLKSGSGFSLARRHF
jgi:predicted GIY-YIG superfamily endonuclease